MFSVYVLNNSYECVSKCSVSRAINLIRDEKAEVVKYSEQVWHTVSAAIKIPLIIKIFKYVKVYNRRLHFSNSLVWDRDDFTCQYCNKLITEKKDLTTDHVFPKSRGGKNTYENMVTACSYCNKKKNDRTPEESGMFPKRKPFRPTMTRRMKEVIDEVQLILKNI